ncbi:hypothetical protein KCU61_g7180, partial [Aureobasidium melanogenum]
MTDLDFFHSREDGYWPIYLAARPKYHLSNFYDRIWRYHREHGNGKFDLAHDIATGPGNVAAELAKHFKQVVASDANAEHVEVARNRLRNFANVSTVTAPAEGIGQHELPASVDMVVVAEAIALMDQPRALAAFHTILKSDGTLAVWFYGRPHIMSTDGFSVDQACSNAYLALAAYMFRPIISPQPERWSRPASHIHNWFDDLVFPATSWNNVQRHKWNPDLEMFYCGLDVGGLEVTRADSVVGPHEEVTSEIDRSLWSEAWTAEDAKRFLLVNMPSLESKKYASDQEFQRLFGQMEKAFGGSDVARQVAWPVILMSATKR